MRRQGSDDGVSFGFCYRPLTRLRDTPYVVDVIVEDLLQKVGSRVLFLDATVTASL